MTSPAHPRQLALDAAILADATLAATLAGDKVYDRPAPEGTPFPFVVIGEPRETNARVFDKAGVFGGEWLHIYAKDRLQAMLVYGQLKTLLHDKPLTVAGFEYLGGKVAMVTGFVDPDGGYKVVADYTLQNLEA